MSHKSTKTTISTPTTTTAPVKCHRKYNNELKNSRNKWQLQHLQSNQTSHTSKPMKTTATTIQTPRDALQTSSIKAPTAAIRLSLSTPKRLHMFPLLVQFALLLLLLLLFGTQSTNAFCPSKCQCLGGDANSRAYCVDAALEDVPIQLNPETKYINLTLNKIRNLEFTLPFYMKLEVLDLSQNIIETLGSKNFEYQTEMRTLNLSRNSVSSLQKDAFKGLTNLLLLDLSYNRIETVHSSSMIDLTALIELDLTNNNIVSLEDNCFRNMISLEILVFKNNQLLDVPANNLQHLHALKSLDLSDNLVEYVRNDSFEGLKELLMLTMRGNVISELDLSAFEGLITLKQLELADNNLTMVPTQQLSKLSNLTYLSLSGNRFTHLPAVAFLNLFHLRELHLNRLDRLQRIDSRAFVDNTHLQSLYLTNNPQLYDIPLRLFQGNPNILEVFMQSNSLQTLYAAQFPVDQLEKLYLGDNPLQCNCSLLWLWRLVTGNFDNTHELHGGHENSGAAVAALGVARNGNNDAVGAMAAYVADNNQQPNAIAKTIELSTTTTVDKSGGTNTGIGGGYLKLDVDHIGCDIWQDNKRTRRLLAAMSESEITCPAHIVTIVCAVLTCLLVLMTGASIIFYLRFIKRRRKLLHDRSIRSGKSIVNVHDRILQHQPLSGNGSLNGGTTLSYPHHTLQTQTGHHPMHPLHHHHDYHQTLPHQVDKLELERYLAAQAIANEYRALKPWELPVKDNSYTDEPEHLYEKFDHYEYPDTQTMTKVKQATLKSSAAAAAAAASVGGTLGNGSGVGIGIGNNSGANSLSKPHIVYV